MRRIVVCLLVLVPLAGVRADEGGDRARLKELVESYREVEKCSEWPDVKRRRELLGEMARLDCEEALPVLYRAFLEDREPVCRIPAMEGVVHCGNTKARKMLVRAAIGDRNDLYVKLLPEALAGCADEELAAWLVDSVLPKRRSPDVRSAVVEALGKMGAADAAKPVRKILDDGGRDVRLLYESLLALARIEGARAAPEIEPWLENEAAPLREAAVRALGVTGDAAALAATFPLARDASPLVQEAVVQAVHRAKAKAGIPALIGLLEGSKSLRATDAARRALEEMTGKCFGFDAQAWRGWWKARDPDAPLTPAKTASDCSVATYYGMGIHSDRLVFVLDVSGSMRAGRPSRIETARQELAKTLGTLSERTRFNVVAFSGSPIWWRDAAVPASPKNVDSAKRFVAALSPGGGTNVWDTLVETFEKNADVDTIFFLGDGSPSRGRVTEPEEILARVRWMNRLRHVEIHTIALLRGGTPPPVAGARPGTSGPREDDEEEAARFMARLSAVTGGTFLKIR